MSVEPTEVQLDALKEIGTIGAGSAATGLSKLLGRRIQVEVPSAEVVAIEQVPEVLGGAEKLICAIYFDIAGNISGSLLLVFPLKEALNLAGVLLGKPESEPKILDEFAQSALKELGNISSGAYLVALSEVIKMPLVHSVPGIATDMLQAVLDAILVQIADKVERAVVIETKFEIEKETVKGHFLFLPDPDGFKTLFGALNGGYKK